MPIQEESEREIAQRLGAVPPILACARGDGVVLRSLWHQMLDGYLDCPVPPLAKERLLAYLARYCTTPYHLACHSSALHGLAASGADIRRLLTQPAPDAARLKTYLRQLDRQPPTTAPWPDPETPAELAIIACCVVVFLEQGAADRCRSALRRYLGEPCFHHLLCLLSYARSSHLWAEAHGELDWREDPRCQRHLDSLLSQEPQLADFFRDYGRQANRERHQREHHLLAEIAQREQVEEALRESESRFRRATSSAPFPVMIYAEDGEVIQVNEAWTELSGYALADIPTVGHWMRRAFGRSKRFIKEDVQALLASDRRVEEGEYTISARSGEKRTWDFSSAPLGRLPDGRRLVICMASDTSERRQLEESLWETNRAVVSIMESITDGFVSMDRQWRVIYFNRQAERMTGMSREQAMGRDVRSLFPRERVASFIRDFEQSMEDGQPLHFERQDPAGRWLEVNAYPSPDGLSIYFRDVSERKRIEERVAFQASLLANINDAVSAVDCEGRVVYWNKAAERLFGFAAHEVIGQDPHPLLRTRWPASMSREAINARVEAGKPWRGLLYHHTKSGRELTLDATGASLRGADGRSIGRLVVLRDVTEQRRIDESLRQTNQRLEALIAASPLGVVLLDDQVRVRLWSPAAERMFGWTEAEVLGQRLPTVPETELAEFMAKQAEIREHGGIGVIGGPRHRKDGSPLTTGGWAAPLYDADGVARSTIALVADVTERHRAEQALRFSEEKFRSIFENSGLGIFQSTPGGQLMSVNRAFARMFGYESPEAMIGLVKDAAADMYGCPERRREVLAQVLAADGAVALEVECRRRDGRPIVGHVTMRAVKDPAGNLLYLEGFVEVTAGCMTAPAKPR